MLACPITIAKVILITFETYMLGQLPLLPNNGYPQIIGFIPYQAMLKYGLKPPEKLEELVKPVLAHFEPAGLRQASAETGSGLDF